MKRPRPKNLGTVYLVGAGPGDPGLLTLRARELLARAGSVFYDHLIHPEILKHAKPGVLVDVGKRGYHGHIHQQRIERLLVQAARRHACVVRLKGGDPFVFGRGGEEAEALRRAGVPFEIVPGVTSAVAVPAYAGIPLTHRDFGSSVVFVTGHEDPKKHRGKGPELDWESLARQPTLVFLMGVRNLAENFRKLIRHGKNPATPAAIVEWGTYGRQRSLSGDLNSLPRLARAERIEAPAITVVGEVAALRGRLNWFEAKPLFGKRIVVTSGGGSGAELGARLREWGAEVLDLPTLATVPPRSLRALDLGVARLERYDWLLFTSAHGVEAFLAALRRVGKDLRDLKGLRLAAVGPMTARRMEGAGLRVDRRPREFTSDALAAAFRPGELRGKRLLFPRAERGRDEILRRLRRQGARVDLAVAYRSLCPRTPRRRLAELFGGPPPDLLTFASGAAAENFAALLRKTPYWRAVKKIPSAVIGPITAAAARRLGLKVVAMPRDYTLAALGEAVLRYFR